MTFFKGDQRIDICELPGYKKPTLLIGSNTVLHKVASFNDKESADEFVSMLQEWFGLREDDLK